MNKNKKGVASVLFAGAMMVMSVGCATQKGATSKGSIEGSGWKMVSMVGMDSKDLSESDAYTLLFKPQEKSVAGRGACNRYFGSYELTAKGLDIRMGGSTRMACPGMNGETPYFQMLDQADDYRVKEGKLTLYKEGKECAVFQVVKK